jgi:hypothetical protein
MTQKDIFGKDVLKMSGISPSSTKNNHTSKYMNFSLVKNDQYNQHEYDEQDLELPDGLKDLGDSDFEGEDFEESNGDNTGDGLSVDENLGTV